MYRYVFIYHVYINIILNNILPYYFESEANSIHLLICYVTAFIEFDVDVHNYSRQVGR